jgi:hypothetical protein
MICYYVLHFEASKSEGSSCMMSFIVRNEMTDSRQRHGCLTAWLIYLIVVNFLVSLLNLAAGAGLLPQINSNLEAQGVNIAVWQWLLLAGLGLFNITGAIALFYWKKWGFYGIAASYIAAFIINTSVGLSLGTSILGCVGLAILYGVLNIGGENRAWSRLN